MTFLSVVMTPAEPSPTLVPALHDYGATLAPNFFSVISPTLWLLVTIVLLFLFILFILAMYARRLRTLPVACEHALLPAQAEFREAMGGSPAVTPFSDVQMITLCAEASAGTDIPTLMDTLEGLMDAPSAWMPEHRRSLREGNAGGIHWWLTKTTVFDAFPLLYTRSHFYPDVRLPLRRPELRGGGVGSASRSCAHQIHAGKTLQRGWGIFVFAWTPVKPEAATAVRVKAGLFWRVLRPKAGELP